MRDITPLIAPRSIAVIGASSNPTKSGGVLFANLANGGFKGPLYPINKGAAEIMGHKAYPALADVPEPVDLVYIVLPQAHVAEAIRAMRRCQGAFGLHHHRRIFRGKQKGPHRRGRLAQDRRTVRPADGRPEHYRHGQCRLRHDGKLREFSALGKGWRVVLHPDRHLHRRGHAARDERGNPTPAGVEKHRRRQQDRRR